MAGFKLTVAARRDLLEIGRFTLEQWGEEQCHRYLTQLDACFRALGKDPNLGRPCDEIRAGYWRRHEGRHVVFYRLARGTRKGVEIVRVLHARMLPRRHL